MANAPGKVRVVREDAEGNVVRILGPHQVDRIDYTNNDASQQEHLYYNVSISDRVGAPANAETKTAPNASWMPGEVLRIQHQANSGTPTLDYDFDGVNVEILEQDQNRGSIAPETLTVDDQELSSNPTSGTDGWTTFYEATVPNRTQWRIAGSFEAVAEANA